jgi:cation diffusion facilitator CzcD-associated flavoprotein CzcO
MATDVDIAILGAGFSGLGMAAQLDRAGRRRWRIFEQADAIGGTWRDNVYPGAACDVPSHLYSFSFALNTDWQHVYARQGEIRQYLKDVSARFGLRDRISLGCGVVDARWSDGAWLLTLSTGETTRARVVVSGVGALRDPRLPDIPGIPDFRGRSMHSARWDPGIDLRGKRVALVGTGASAIQIGPAIVDQVERLTVYQRTPPWVRDRDDRPFTEAERRRFRLVPGAARARRWATYLHNEVRYPVFFGTWHRFGERIGEPVLKWLLRRRLRDPSVAAKVTPRYRLGCKRILVSSAWYPMLNSPRVRVEDRPIERVTSTGIEVAGGEHQEHDVIVWCTGFRVDQPMGRLRVVGVAGRSLSDAWGRRPRAYLGITVPDFPNLFLLLGPNTALGHSSVVLMIEAQIRYVLGALRALDQRGGAMDVKPEALAGFMAEVDRGHATRVWGTGCDSWYLSEGKNFTLWPGATARYIARTWRFDPKQYRWVGATTPR